LAAVAYLAYQCKAVAVQHLADRPESFGYGSRWRISGVTRKCHRKGQERGWKPQDDDPSLYSEENLSAQ